MEMEGKYFILERNMKIGVLSDDELSRLQQLEAWRPNHMNEFGQIVTLYLNMIDDENRYQNVLLTGEDGSPPGSGPVIRPIGNPRNAQHLDAWRRDFETHRSEFRILQNFARESVEHIRKLVVSSPQARSSSSQRQIILPNV